MASDASPRRPSPAGDRKRSRDERDASPEHGHKRTRDADHHRGRGRGRQLQHGSRQHKKKNMGRNEHLWVRRASPMPPSD